MSAEGRRPVGWIVAAVVGASLLGLLTLGGRGGGDRPLDPRSHERLGTSALVALASDLGADVEIADRLPGGDSDADVILLLTDLLDESERAQVEAWIGAGGTLVVVDPASTFVPDRLGRFRDVDGLEERLGGPPSTCDIGPLDGIDTSGVEPRNGGVLYDVPPGAASCLGDGRRAYIVATPSGQGTVVSIGGSGLLANAALAEGENAPVVAALLAPEASTDLVVLEPGPLASSGQGQEGLFDLVPSGVWWALLQVAIAFAVYVLWRARRLGAPVAEPQPVAVAGSELVAAVGTLLDRTGSVEHAAGLLRADLHRLLAERLGVPPATPPEMLAAIAAERVGADRDRVTWALTAAPLTDERQLIELAQTIDSVREEVLHHV